MRHVVTSLIVLAGLLNGADVRAEDLKLPSQKTQEALEAFSSGPGAIAAKLKAAVAPAASDESDARSRAPTGASARATVTSSPEASATTRMPRRDPFRPFTLNVRPAARRRQNLAPLKRYELGQLKLVGVVWDPSEPRAMVEDSGGLGYIVRVGTPIGPNNGTVKAIRPNEITIEEDDADSYDARRRRHVSMRISPERGQ